MVALGLPSDMIDTLGDAYDVAVWPESQPMPEAVLRDWLADAHGVLCALSTQLNAALLENASRLKVISTISVGVDHIDITAATQLGIPVGHTPGVLVDSTADLALGLMLAVTRRMAEADRWVRAGNWAQGWQSDLLIGTDLSQATIGIVGLGAIGRAVIRRLQGFGSTVLAWNRTPKNMDGVQMVELDELFVRSDIVSLHTAMTPETTHIADRNRLSSMRAGAALINTGRGLLVDETALIDEVDAGRLNAGLDVFSVEPLRPGHPFLSQEKVVLLPHVGSATASTRSAMVSRALENLHAGMAGQALPYCANPEVYPLSDS